MRQYVQLDLEGYKVEQTGDSGAAPSLEWIAVDRLVVDKTYQRDILKQGRANVASIARAFCWAYFAPVIVSPVEGGKFAIVDGQHRATAAALVGKKTIPCQIVVMDARQQAKAFAAINGNVTRMSALNVFRAALAAGDNEAVAVHAACKAGGVRILGYPMAAPRMAIGDCTCPAQCVKLMRRYGPDILEKACAALAQGGQDTRGLINPSYLAGLCMLFERKPLDRKIVPVVFAHVRWKTVEKAARESIDSFACGVRDAVAAELVRISRGAR